MSEQESYQQVLQPEVNADEVARKVADYQKTSGILWIAIGVLQIISVFAVIAGVWNIVAGINGYKLSKKIKAHEAWVVPSFENSLNGIIIIAVVNLFLGGVIGIAFAAFDYYIRDYVMKNRSAFEQ